MIKIGIIGSGFAGMMTAVQLVHQSNQAFEIVLIDEDENFNKGIAYKPYSDKHLLNVVTGKMSAFPYQPDHFLDWVMQKSEFKNKERLLIANSFLPRKIYGEYLCSIWEETKNIAFSKQIKITVINCLVCDLDIVEYHVDLQLGNGIQLSVDHCVIATGNHIPRNPSIQNMDFYRSPNYFQNPWKIESVKGLRGNLPVLIIGNGLTMVDAVFGLLEQGFQAKIYSISPHGFNILPHRHNGMKYNQLVDSLGKEMRLYDLVKTVLLHIRKVREFGISAEPIIDSLRPKSQKIWRSLTDEEKELFLSRFRHLWGVARHRIPLHSHDKIQQLRIDGKLHIHSGRLMNMHESAESVNVEYFDKKEKKLKEIKVSRVINCTGPETDLMNLQNHFLKKCLIKGILKQDKLKLGIQTDIDTFQIIKFDGVTHSNLYTLGSNLKGELWESTAVNEIRDQAERLAQQLIALNHF